MALALIGARNDESLMPRITKTADKPPGLPEGRDNGVTGAAGGSELERGPEVPDVAGKSLEGAVRIIPNAGFVVAAIKTRAGQGAPETAIRTGPSRRPCKTGGAYDPHDGQRVDRSLIKSPRRECQRRHLRRAECSGW